MTDVDEVSWFTNLQVYDDDMMMTTMMGMPCRNVVKWCYILKLMIGKQVCAESANNSATSR